MIISDLSVFEVVEDSAHIQGGFLPVFTGPNGNVAGNGTNNASATASGLALNPFSTGSIIGVSSASTQANTDAVVVLGGGSQSDSLSGASIGFVPGPNNAPLLLAFPLQIKNP